MGLRGLGETAADHDGYGPTIAAVSQALIRMLPGLSSTAIDYPTVQPSAVVDDQSAYDASVAAGSDSLTQYISEFESGPCGQVSKLLVAGFSEGADIAAQSINGLDRDQQYAISGLVLISDPRFNPLLTAVDRGSFASGNGLLVNNGGLRAMASPMLTATADYCAADDTLCDASVSVRQSCEEQWTSACTSADYQDTDFHGAPYTTDAARYLLIRYAHDVRSPQTAWGWGNNNSGQLGNGTTANNTLPGRVDRLTNVVGLAAGRGTGYALRRDGSVWAWGSNGWGELGNGVGPGSTVPVKIHGLHSVKQVVSGLGTGYALLADGTVWAWGYNEYGQLGNRLSAWPFNLPTQIEGLSDVTQIAAGSLTAYALRADGTVWSWGSNNHYALGAGISDRGVSTRIPTQVNPTSMRGPVKAIAAGAHTGYALRTDGQIMVWGDNTDGEAGVWNPPLSGNDLASPVESDAPKNMVSISAGAVTAYGVDSTGTAWSWGGGRFGEQGRALRNDVDQISTLSHVSRVVSGPQTHAAYAILDDGSLWAWGWNCQGELGIGTTDNQPLPVQVGNISHVTAVAAGEGFTFAAVR